MVLEIGFRFLPPDEEIISFFLLNKMMGNHDRTHYIREIDLLKQEPWELPVLSIVQSRYPEWVFFYRINKISDGKTDRTTEGGYWKSTGQDREVKEGGSLIGSKKTLVFYNGRTPRGVKTDWVMHEYRAIPALTPSNSEVNNYVVGILRNKAVEKTETSASNCGQSGNHLTASSSQSVAVGATHLEAAAQLRSDMDYEIALQTQLADRGIFDHDLLTDFDLPSSGGVTNNGLITMEEEGICLDDLLLPDDFVDDELLPQFNDDTTEQEIGFMRSTFHYQDEHSYEETGYSFLPDCRAPEPDYAGDIALRERIVHMSGGSGHGHSEGFNQKRMENSIRHDDILIMDSSVDSATITTLQSNCLESLWEEKSVNSRTCKSQYEPKSHKSVVQAHPKRVQLQVKSSRKSESGDMTRESGVGSAVVELARTKKSVVQSKKYPKMDGDRNTKSDADSRCDGSAGSSRKNTLNFVETPQLSCKEKPALVYVGNVVLGLILIIAVLEEVISLH